MSRLWDDARRILETAERAGSGTGDWTLFRRQEGGWEMIAGAAWNLDALAADRGAAEVYQLRHEGATLCVEGRAGLRSLRLEQPDPQAHARRVLGARDLSSGAMYIL